MHLFWLFSIFLLVSSEVEGRDSVSGTVQIKRTEADLWRVTYCFNEPIGIFGFERPIEGMREMHWHPETEGMQLKYNAEHTAQLYPVDGRPFTCGAIDLTPSTDIPTGKDYYPFTPFSDGGMTMYTGFLVGSVYQKGEWKNAELTASYQPLEGERVVAAEPNRLGHQFVYFGPQEAVETDETILIIDPALPDLIREPLLSTIKKANALLPQAFGYKPPHKYLVFMGAGNLEKHDGMNVKGGAGPHQIRFTLEGLGAINVATREPLFYPKLAVHEVLHLWQRDVWHYQLSNPHQWVHEGGADAVTYEMMRMAGLYDADTYAKNWKNVEMRCVQLLKKSSVHKGAVSKNNDVLYQCGAFINYLIGASINPSYPGDGILQFWQKLAAWDKATILSLENEALYLKTMAKVGLDNEQQAAVRLFVAEKHDDPMAAVADMKKLFGVIH